MTDSRQTVLGEFLSENMTRWKRKREREMRTYSAKLDFCCIRSIVAVQITLVEKHFSSNHLFRIIAKKIHGKKENTSNVLNGKENYSLAERNVMKL